MPRALPWLALLALLAPACATRAVTSLAPPIAPDHITVANDVPIGTAHPVTVVDVDPHARWVVLCQAREDTDHDGEIATWNDYPGMHGDTMKPYLIVGPGPGILLDDYIGADRSGEHLVLLHHGRLLVHHVGRGRTEVLRHADLLDDADTIYPSTEHRAAAIDRDRGILAYHLARKPGQASTLVVRNLQTDAHHYTRLPGLLQRASFSDDGSWLLLGLLTRDTDGDSLLNLSRNDLPLGPRACFGTYPMHHGSPDHRGDDPQPHAVPVKRGRPRPIPGLIRAFADHLILREPDDAIVAVTTNGRRREWAPAACHARLLGVSIPYQRALVLCDRDGPHQARVEIHGPGVHHPLRTHEPEIQSFDSRDSWDRFARFAAVDGTYVVDLVNFAEWRVPDGHRLRTMNERGAVLATGEQFVQWDLPAGTLTPTSDPWAFLRDDVDLAQSRAGRRLRLAPPSDPNTRPASLRVVDYRVELPRGPLVWHTPSP